jgi:hypothetical protein
MDWKRAVRLALLLTLLGLAGCGGPGGGSISHLKARAFLSDNFDGTLHIENAMDDLESGITIPTGSQPGFLSLAPDKLITLVFDAGAGSLAVVSNPTETVLGRITMPGPTTSYVSLGGDTVGFVAVTNSALSPCIPRCVEVVDEFTTFSVNETINVDSITQQPLNASTTLVLSPTQNDVLVFGGPAEHVDTFTVIDTSLAQTSPSTAAVQIASPLLDRPVYGLISSDGTTAYIMNCGPECGGTTASVAVVDLTQSPPVVTMNIPVDGASVGMFIGSTLYVAGSPPGAACTCPPGTACEMPPTTATTCGRLEIINTGATPPAVTTSGVVISDGFHNHMELTANNKIFIGAVTCSDGCLTIYDITANQAGVDAITGDVTGIAPITGRNVVYVVENVAAGTLDCVGQLPCLGKLRIYDDSASVPTLTPEQISVVGKAVDVKFVD